MEEMFDTHAHYYDARFGELGGADAVLPEIFSHGVCGVVNVGTDLENSRTVVDMAAKYEKMYAAVGIHPTDGMRYADPAAALSALSTMLGDRETRKREKIVAIGEIGLDYHWDDTDRARQKFLFEEQMKLAGEHDLPVIIHDRDAHGDTMDILLRYPAARGVLHSFSGSAEMARDLARRGWYISFSGTVTFKNAPRVREAAAAVPADKLLVETDAPYLAPHPMRGACNRSDYLTYTTAALAEARGERVEEICRLTTENARRLFAL